MAAIKRNSLIYYEANYAWTDYSLDSTREFMHNLEQENHHNRDKDQLYKRFVDPFSIEKITVKEHDNSLIRKRFSGLDSSKIYNEYRDGNFIKKRLTENNEIMVSNVEVNYNEAHSKYNELEKIMRSPNKNYSDKQHEEYEKLQQDLLNPPQREGYYTDMQRNYEIIKRCENIINGNFNNIKTESEKMRENYNDAAEEALEDFREAQYDFEEASLKGIFDV